MKAIKMLGLAALAALLAMAFAGATSAMAESTALCKVDENPCAAANQITSVSEESVGKGILLNSIINVQCIVLFNGTVSGEALSSPLKITGNFKYEECTTGCVVAEENGPSTISVLKEGHETASVVGEGLVTVNCTGLINCSYNGVGLKGAGKGPLLAAKTNPRGEVSLFEQSVNKEAGTLCPKTGTLDLTTTPKSVTTYITN